MIRLEQVSTAHEALREICTVFEQGRSTAIIGQNGAGKTTLLRTIARLQETTSGSIEIQGRSLSEFSPTQIAETICWAPHRIELPFPVTVSEFLLNMRFPWHQGIPQRDDHQAVDEAIERFRLQEHAKHYTNTLSAGEWRRIQLARAITSPCPILLIDEPEAHLDIKGQRELIETLGEAEGKTILVVTHNLEIAAKSCSQFIALRQGRLVKTGDASSIRDIDVTSEVFDC